MTVSQTFTFSIEITVDDEDADLLTELVDKVDISVLEANAIRSLTDYTFNGYRRLHRAVLARQGYVYDKGFCADHIDKNPGNNRRNNLRIVTDRQNNMNRSNTSNVVSGFYGVSYQQRSGKWLSRVHIGTTSNNGKAKKHSKYIGLFDSEQDAAKAYDAYIIANSIDKPLNFKEV